MVLDLPWVLLDLVIPGTQWSQQAHSHQGLLVDLKLQPVHLDQVLLRIQLVQETQGLPDLPALPCCLPVPVLQLVLLDLVHLEVPPLQGILDLH